MVHHKINGQKCKRLPSSPLRAETPEGPTLQTPADTMHMYTPTRHGGGGAHLAPLKMVPSGVWRVKLAVFPKRERGQVDRPRLGPRAENAWPSTHAAEQ